MNLKNTLRASLAGAAALAVAGGYIAQHESSNNRSADQPSSARIKAASAQTALIVPSLLDNAACDLEAVPTLPSDLDARVADAAGDTPFAQALSPASALDQAAAISQAIAMSSSPDGVTAVAVASVPFSIGGALLNDPSHPLVAPSRCTWLLTVVGAYTADSARPGATPTTAQGYTVAIDAASGEVLDLLAGPQAPSLITGIGL